MGAANSHRRLSKPITGKMGKRKSIPDEKGKYQNIIFIPNIIDFTFKIDKYHIYKTSPLF